MTTTPTTKTPIFAWVLLAASLTTFGLAFSTTLSGPTPATPEAGAAQNAKPAH